MKFTLWRAMKLPTVDFESSEAYPDGVECSVCGEPSIYRTYSLDVRHLCRDCYLNWIKMSNALRSRYGEHPPKSLRDYWMVEK